MAALHAYATPITGPDVHHLGGRNFKEQGVFDRIYADTLKSVVTVVETLAERTFRDAVSGAEKHLKTMMTMKTIKTIKLSFRTSSRLSRTMSKGTSSRIPGGARDPQMTGTRLEQVRVRGDGGQAVVQGRPVAVHHGHRSRIRRGSRRMARSRNVERGAGGETASRPRAERPAGAAAALVDVGGQGDDPGRSHGRELSAYLRGVHQAPKVVVVTTGGVHLAERIAVAFADPDREVVQQRALLQQRALGTQDCNLHRLPLLPGLGGLSEDVAGVLRDHRGDGPRQVRVGSTTRALSSSRCSRAAGLVKRRG